MDLRHERRWLQLHHFAARRLVAASASALALALALAATVTAAIRGGIATAVTGDIVAAASDPSRWCESAGGRA